MSMKFVKRKRKSIYFKWILMFTCFIFAAQFITSFLSLLFLVPYSISNFNEKLYLRAQFIQNMYYNGVLLDNETLNEFGDINVHFIDLDTKSIPNDIGIYSDIITFTMLREAEAGEIVSSYSGSYMNKMPFSLVLLGDKIALLTPDYHKNEIITLRKGITTSIIMGTVIGYVFILIALVLVIRPIKKVTAATKEVAAGNFDVELKFNSKDEVGQLIENFNAMARELKKNDYLRKDFVSSVSHEFKTPITSIEGFAKLLKNKNLTPQEFEEYTDIIIKETKRLSHMSSNLLKLSLLDSSEFKPRENEFYLDEQIRNVILLLERYWEEKDITFDIDMDEIKYTGCEELLSQVWINLIQNAIKFSPEKASIGVSLKKTDKSLCIKILDEGIGVGNEHGEKIFNRFYKADKSHAKEGSGLGLSITKRIVEISGGNIRYKSRPGKSTEFIVELPLN